MVSKLVWHLSDTSNHSAAFPPSDPLSGLLVFLPGDKCLMVTTGLLQLQASSVSQEGKVNLSQMAQLLFYISLAKSSVNLFHGHFLPEGHYHLSNL